MTVSMNTSMLMHSGYMVVSWHRTFFVFSCMACTRTLVEEDLPDLDMLPL